MLICPQCQRDNPNQNQLCQYCKTSLIHKICFQCGAEVSYADQKCSSCGAFTGTVWWAIIADIGSQHLEDTEPLQNPQKKPSPKSPSSDSPASPLTESTPESPSSSPVLKTLERSYLDHGKRYCLLEQADHQGLPTSDLKDKRIRFNGRVLDCQPLHKSVLKALLEQQSELFHEEETESEASKDIKAFLWHQIGIPELAFPYLNLKEFWPAIPELHDAWHDGTQEVILLADRGDWQLLSEAWTTHDSSLLQLVYWFNEMAKLWKVLSEHRCCQSLLIEGNLRVDEDQTFGLQQLYFDSSAHQPTLQDLGKMWQYLLESCPSSGLEALQPLLEDLINGKISATADLRLNLQELAEKQQILPEDIEEDSTITQPFNLEQVDSFSLPNTLQKEEDNGQDTGPKEDSLLPEEISEGFSTAVIPMQLHSLIDTGYTDIGRQRRHNEDHFGINTEVKKQLSNRGQTLQAKGLYIVCDGMGGHASGEVASALAVETLQRFFLTHSPNELPDAETITQGILLANQTIYRINQEKDSHGSGRMGTTLVMALVQDNKIAIAHVGDSRIYRVNRKWGLEQLTVDHEVGQRAIQEGVAPKVAYSRPDAYQLTQALGPHDDQYVKPDIKYLQFNEDTLLLLCSDGLSDNKFVEANWKSVLVPLLSSSTLLDEGLKQLIALANQQNGHDNITAILIRIKVQPSREQPLWL